MQIPQSYSTLSAISCCCQCNKACLLSCVYQALNSSSVLPDFANTNTLSANVPADSSSEALIKAEYPSAGTIAAPLHGVQTSLTDSPQLTSRQSSSPAKPATIRSGEFSLIGQSRQDTGTQGTMSLSEVPPAVQQSIQYSDAHEPKSFSQTRTMSSDGAASKTQTGIRSAESASSVILPNTTSVDVVPVVNVELSEQPLLRQSAEQADSFQQTTNAERHSIDAGTQGSQPCMDTADSIICCCCVLCCHPYVKPISSMHSIGELCSAVMLAVTGLPRYCQEAVTNNV